VKLNFKYDQRFWQRELNFHHDPNAILASYAAEITTDQAPEAPHDAPPTAGTSQEKDIISPRNGIFPLGARVIRSWREKSPRYSHLSRRSQVSNAGLWLRIKNTVLKNHGSFDEDLHRIIRASASHDRTASRDRVRESSTSITLAQIPWAEGPPTFPLMSLSSSATSTLLRARCHCVTGTNHRTEQCILPTCC